MDAPATNIIKNALEDPELKKLFEKEIKHHELMILKVCRMYTQTEADQQDLFQDIILQLWQSYTRFRAEAKFSTWLYRVALNTAISNKRKKKGIITYMEPGMLPVNRCADETADYQEERIVLLQQAITSLNEIEKAIVILYMEERTYEEMEEILGIKTGTLRVKMNRVKEKLRQLTNNHQHGT